MSKATRISISDAFNSIQFLPDRTPNTSDAAAAKAFATLSDFRDGAIFIGHYAGYSEWERHSKGDEFVYVVAGETTLILLQQGKEKSTLLQEGEFLVVPENTWHRFETPNAVKILTITPQPTDHSIERPD